MLSLTFLLGIVLAVLFWQASLRSRDTAFRIARDTCHQQDLQLLDGTVALRRLVPYYKHSNDFGIKRNYIFEYSNDGINRQVGCVIMHNSRIVTVLLEGGTYD